MGIVCGDARAGAGAVLECRWARAALKHDRNMLRERSTLLHSKNASGEPESLTESVDHTPPSEKSALEVKKLRQEILTDRIKTAAIAFGAISLVFTFALDRYKLYEQREYESRTNVCRSSIDRMTAIAVISEKQLSDTTSALVRNRSRTWLLVTNVLVLRSKLDQLSTDDPEIADLMRYFDNVIGELQTGEASVDEWADAARVEALWRLQTGGYTPDFAALFGSDARQLWGDTATKAVVALQAVYSISGQHETSKIDFFRDASETLQSTILEQIVLANAQCK